MTRLQIYNMALRVHGRKITQEDLDATDKREEVLDCIESYESAQDKALSEADWPFFTSLLELDLTEDTPGYGFSHGYALPSGLYRHTPRAWEWAYEIHGGVYYTDAADPKLYGMLRADCFDKADAAEDTRADHPQAFDNLIAYALAYDLCGYLSPNDQNLLSVALQRYTWALQQLKSANISDTKQRWTEPLFPDLWVGDRSQLMAKRFSDQTFANMED